MSKYITVQEVDPKSSDAIHIMDELSNDLESITGNSGRGSFNTSDACGQRAVFAIARNQDGEAVGCGAIRPIDENTAEVKRMYAKEKGIGVGTKVLSYLETKAQKMGYSVLRLETRLINQRAVSFYENSGYYRILNYGKYVNRPEAVCFEKQLVKEKIEKYEVLTALIKGFTVTNNIENDSNRFFAHHDKQDIAEHCSKVAKEAKRLSEQFGICQETAETAGFLHDISRVIPDNEYLSIASELGIEVVEEEKVSPMLLHQKISKAIAWELFQVNDKNILNAIECHTTLKANANATDLVLFIADKLSWDSADSEPILDGIYKGLEISLEHGAFSYLRHLWDNRNNVKVMHPWTIQAYMDLRKKCLD